MRRIIIFMMVYAVVVLAGCAKQPVVWHNEGKIDLLQGATVTVDALCEMPSSDVRYLQHNIQMKVREVLSGQEDTPDSYKIKVTITKYDEGNAFARLMLIGLGQMHLYGTVEIKQGEPPVVIKTGEFKKNYAAGGIAGGMATMRNNVLPEVGIAIAEAIQPQKNME